MSIPNMGIFRVYNNAWPRKQGPCCLTFKCDFTAIAAYAFDLALEEMQDDMEFIQSVHINNLLNANPLTLKFGGTEQSLTVPLNKQAILPAYAPVPTTFTVTSTVAPVIVTIHFLNVPLGPIVW